MSINEPPALERPLVQYLRDATRARDQAMLEIEAKVQAIEAERTEALKTVKETFDQRLLDLRSRLKTMYRLQDHERNQLTYLEVTGQTSMEYKGT